MDRFKVKKIGKNWSTNKEVDECNKLSSYVVDANTTESFNLTLNGG